MKPYPSYKDSGIEWIGDIPEHWEVKNLRRITKNHKQGYYTTKGYVEDGVKFIRITDLDSNGQIRYDICPQVILSEEDQKIYSVIKGDFLFPRTGSIGLLGFCTEDIEAIFASYLIRFRFDDMNNLFLKYFFISNCFIHGIKSELHGGVNQNIHAENIKNQLIGIPPLSEQ